MLPYLIPHTPVKPATAEAYRRYCELRDKLFPTRTYTVDVSAYVNHDCFDILTDCDPADENTTPYPQRSE